jgi:hypothetical protein
MRCAILLAAAVALAACASQAEDEAAAAPAPDTTTVAPEDTAVTHVIDSTRTGPPGVGGRHGDATVTPDSVLDDTTQVVPDTLSPTGESPSAPQDTLGPGAPWDTTGQADTTTSR